MNQDFKHKNNKRLCYCCNELTEREQDLIVFTIKDRNEQSKFYGLDFNIQLHMNCAKELQLDPFWFDNVTCFDNKTGKYNYEEYIINLIETFILENQEYIYNCNGDLSREEWVARFK